MRTARIEELLRVFETTGQWTLDEHAEASDIVSRMEAVATDVQEHGWTPANYRELLTIMGREAGYIPEGTEDWMQEDGVPRAYDIKRGPRFNAGQEVELSLSPKLDPPPPRPSEPAELAAHAASVRSSLDLTADLPQGLSAAEERIKTLEATVTDLYRRVKALEEKLVG